MKKLLSVLIAAGMLFAVAGTATAGLFLPLDSTLTYKLGALAPIKTQGTYVYNGWATLTNNGTLHDLSDRQGIWLTVGNSPGTSLFTGVALLDDLKLTVVNNAGSFTASYSAANPVGGNLTGSERTTLSASLSPRPRSGCR